MSNKIISLLMVTIVGAGLLTGCGGDDPIAAPPIVGYDTSTQIQQTPQIQDIQQPANTAPVVKAGTVKTTNTAKVTTTAKPAATGAKTAITAKPAATTTVASATSTLSPAQKIILKTKQTYDSFNTFSATVTMFSKRNETTTPKGNPIINAETKYLFQVPRNEVFNVVKHSVSMVVGAKMIWKGGESAKVKAGGVLGLFPLDLKLTDSKLTTNREWRMDQLDHIGILTRALDKKAELTLAGKSTINGKEAYMIKVKGTGLDSNISEENIAIDTKTFTILADEMYDGKDLVFQTKITIDATNMSIPAGTFEL
jgi:outer membrane lipoprotein-sorting protein